MKGLVWYKKYESSLTPEKTSVGTDSIPLIMRKIDNLQAHTHALTKSPIHVYTHVYHKYLKKKKKKNFLFFSSVFETEFHIAQAGFELLM